MSSHKEESTCILPGVPGVFVTGLEADTSSVQGANCECPAGETQNCIHLAALLLTLVEIGPTACTSLQCLWS